MMISLIRLNVRAKLSGRSVFSKSKEIYKTFDIKGAHRTKTHIAEYIPIFEIILKGKKQH